MHSTRGAAVRACAARMHAAWRGGGRRRAPVPTSAFEFYGNNCVSVGSNRSRTRAKLQYEPRVDIYILQHGYKYALLNTARGPTGYPRKHYFYRKLRDPGPHTLRSSMEPGACITSSTEAAATRTLLRLRCVVVAVPVPRPSARARVWAGAAQSARRPLAVIYRNSSSYIICTTIICTASQSGHTTRPPPCRQRRDKPWLAGLVEHAPRPAWTHWQAGCLEPSPRRVIMIPSEPRCRRPARLRVRRPALPRRNVPWPDLPVHTNERCCCRLLACR